MQHSIVRTLLRSSATFALAAVNAALSASALTFNLGSAAPTPGAYDIRNFTGAARDMNNVYGGAAPAGDGAANDGYTYVAGDRADQGQTFTTGSNTNGYTIQSVWLRHVGYTNNTASTYWQMNDGVSITARVTDPALAGTAGFALHTETYTTTGSEGWFGGYNSTNGTGNWLQFAFSSPITLSPNRTYGFDVASSSTGAFFEWLGTSDNAVAGGTAYNGSTVGASDNALNTLAGDRVFLVELALASPTTNSAYARPLATADPFPNDRVQLLNSRFGQNREVHRTGFLAWLDADRLLYQFRATAGLSQPPGVTHLGGWEGGSGFTAVRGHMLGHYLSAASRMYADTGDVTFLTNINYLVQELRKCQDALGAQEIAAGRVYGYLSGFPSTFFDTLETNPTAAQVPFYTIHKIMAGLVDACGHTTNNLALDIAISMSDYHQWRMARLTPSQIEAMFVASIGHTEWGGMNETLTDLYLLSRARGDANPERHLAFAGVFHRSWFVDPLYSNQDQLDGLHANTHIPQVTGFARVASVLSTNDSQRDRLYTVASNFWHLVINQHWLVLGGNSYAERFSAPGRETGAGGSALSWNTAETCNTHNMLKLTRQLFMHHPSVEYADYYEHALYNHVLASLAPDTGMMTYFVPMNSGHFKTYCLPEGSCWCCTGTGIENPTRYNEAIYFHKGSVLWINLFIPSVLDWSEQGLIVRLDTGFPATNSVKLTLQCPQPTNAILRIRIPSWIAATPTVTLNGVNQGLSPAAGTYLALNRTWTNGDTVEITLPMNLRVDHSMDDASQVSLFYGPILLAGELGTNGLPASDQAPDQGTYSGVALGAVPTLMGDNADDPGGWVASDGSALGFNATAAYPGDAARSLVHLRPFYDVHHERYAVYWRLIAPAGISTWTGGGGSANWSVAANWSFPPTNQCALQFGLAPGGTTANDLAAGSRINGIQFLSNAGAFVLNGNSVVLQGDVVNHSISGQRINLPVQLNGGISWTLDSAAGDLALGGEVSGVGALNKRGAQALTVLSNFTFGGSTRVSEGLLQVGNGGSAGSVGNVGVILDGPATLAFNRGDTFLAANAVSGAGSVAKRGAGTLQLIGSWSNTGPTMVEAGKLQIASQPVQALAHRWSFNGNLLDSAGSANAVVVDVGANNTSLTASNITLTGGSRNASDYVSLGGNLLPDDGSPVTIELWATPVSAQNWSRIFDVGNSTAENLFMSWSQGTDTGLDRVEWKDAGTATVDNSCAPYATGTEYHIALVIEPGAGNGGGARVTWYVAPASSVNLGSARGTFDTGNTLADFNDANFWLGRSEYNDSTANSRYNEVRLWRRTFSPAELQQLHVLGANSVGAFATTTLTGRLSPQSDLKLLAGAQVDIGGTAQQVASLAGDAGAVVHLNGGQLRISAGGAPAATFAGTFSGSGGMVVDGILRLVGDATIAAGVGVTNNGMLDIMTWRGGLPAGFVNNGQVLDRSWIRIEAANISTNDFTLKIHGYFGHAYQLQCRDNLSSGSWQNLGAPRVGSDAPLTLTHPGGAGAAQRFYRVLVSP